jgi:heat-inducible transcriptional repressor
MADLTDLGYLSQPHTSAGRVPTERAFRHFAERAAGRAGSAAASAPVARELETIDTLGGRLEHGSHVLTQLTRNVGIIAAIPAFRQALDQIELVQLPDNRVLMVVVTNDRTVHNQVAKLEEPVTQDDLYSIRNYVNRNFHGWALSDIRRELTRRLEAESSAYDRLLQRLQVLYSKGLLDVDVSPTLAVDGASNLAGVDLQLTRDRLRELFRALEEKKKLIELLDQFLATHPGDLRVQVGLEDAHPSMRSLALIGIHVSLPGGIAAQVAVLGPIRMNYQRAVAAVLQLGHAFQSLPQ